MEQPTKIEKNIEDIAEAVFYLKDNAAARDQDVKDINKDVKDINRNVEDLVEMVSYIKDNAITRDDLHQELQNYATKDDLRQELQNYPTKEDMARMNYDLKCYIDDKNADLAADLGDKIYRKSEIDKSFKREVIDVFKKNSLVDQAQLQHLQDLV